MSRILLRRVILGLLTLLLVSVVVFAATQALPSNAAQAILGRDATPGPAGGADPQLHLDRSGRVAVPALAGRGGDRQLRDLGCHEQPVASLLSGRIANSAFLVLVAALIAMPLSIVLGVLMAIRRDEPTDHVLSMTHAGAGGAAGVRDRDRAGAAVRHQRVPVFPAVTMIPPGEHAWDVPKAIVLPAATLVLAVTPYISRIMRGSMVEVLESEYVTMARLKGLSNRTVIWRHAVPNAIVPAIQVSALQLAYMAGGVVVVEFVFAYPGHRRRAGGRGQQPRRADGAGADDHHRGGLRDREPSRGSDHDRRNSTTADGADDEHAGDRQPTRSRARRRRCASASGRSSGARVLKMWRARIGLVIVAVLVLFALAGPLIAPHSPTAFVGAPNAALGTGAVRHRQPRPRRLEPLLVWRAKRARAVGRLDADRGRTRDDHRPRRAYAGGVIDEILMRIADVFMAFPQIVLALLLVTAFGPKVWLIVLDGRDLARAARRAGAARRRAAGGRARLRQGRGSGR